MSIRSMALRIFLFCFCLAPLMARADFSEGVEYIEVAPQPVETGAKVEVREFFWYGCPHCFHLEPYLSDWRKTMSPRAKFVRTPAIFRDTWEAQARAHYAFEALGIAQKMDPAMFAAIHQQNRTLEDEKSITAFAVENGITEKRFHDAYNSFNMANSLRRGMELQKNYNISSVPTLVVDGRYITSPALARGQAETTKVLDFLISKALKDRKKRAAAR